MSEKPSNNGENIVKRNEKGQLLPGSVLNPAGKPTGVKHMSTALNELLMETVEGDDKGRTYKEMLLKRLMAEAIKRVDPSLVWGIFDRIEGKPDQGVHMKVESESHQSTADVMEIARRVSEELKKKKTSQ